LAKLPHKSRIAAGPTDSSPEMRNSSQTGPVPAQEKIPWIESGVIAQCRLAYFWPWRPSSAARTGLYAYAGHSATSEVITRGEPEPLDLRYLAEPDRVLVTSTSRLQPATTLSRLPNRQVLEIGPDLALILHDEHTTADSNEPAPRRSYRD
jgi:hypothetical protein